ncbi:UDP-N-acetylglucosamine 2-epimerase [Telmatobacter sp. DSM 110680]|uniref:UDP-N-acetylglucosamine 2-epimerase n=1 Tax=Telmatobacter sp. DSM 110680 TaxID=3036704 RepID=A0AAU7DEN7_9BACT
MTRRKICVVTTSRADFGLLQKLMQCIDADRALELQVIASGMHLAAKFGRTVREIEAAGIKVDRKIKLSLIGGSALANAKSIGVGIPRFGDAFTELRPAIVVLLGDRFEILAPATAALMLQIPIAHIHGGERSEGAIDESIRHAITKMAALHFAATETYRRRIIQMGESPKQVFNFGAPGLDQLYDCGLLTRVQLEEELGLSLQEPVALVTYHPVTRNSESTEVQIKSLVGAIRASGLKAVFTMANADAQGSLINIRLQAACAQNPERFKWIPHLGHRRYLSCLKHFTLMVGNSSSGLIEAPSFRLPVVNIGERQRGRVRSPNVIDVRCSQAAIQHGIKRATSPRFRHLLRGMRNPYDRFHDGLASERIKDILKSVEVSGDLLTKRFYDLPRK